MHTMISYDVLSSTVLLYHTNHTITTAAAAAAIRGREEEREREKCGEEKREKVRTSVRALERAMVVASYKYRSVGRRRTPLYTTTAIYSLSVAEVGFVVVGLCFKFFFFFFWSCSVLGVSMNPILKKRTKN